MIIITRWHVFVLPLLTCRRRRLSCDCEKWSRECLNCWISCRFSWEIKSLCDLFTSIQTSWSSVFDHDQWFYHRETYSHRSHKEKYSWKYPWWSFSHGWTISEVNCRLNNTSTEQMSTTVLCNESESYSSHCSDASFRSVTAFLEWYCLTWFWSGMMFETRWERSALLQIHCQPFCEAQLGERRQTGKFKRICYIQNCCWIISSQWSMTILFGYSFSRLIRPMGISQSPAKELTSTGKVHMKKTRRDAMRFCTPSGWSNKRIWFDRRGLNEWRFCRGHP
jgi:hypothetical protein